MIKYIFMLILYFMNYVGKTFEKIENSEEYKLKMGCPTKFRPIKL